MKLRGRSITPKKLFLILYDSIMSVLALVLSLFLTNQHAYGLDLLQPTSLLLISCFFSALIIFHLIGLYNQMWLYASILQYLLVPIAIFAQTIVMIFLQLVLFPFPIIWVQVWTYFSLLVFALIAVRVFYRLYRSKRIGVKQRIRFRRDDIKMIRVLIVGAGRAGSRLAEDLKEINGSRFPVAFVDDNPKTHHYQHMGIPVLGGRKEIPIICETYKIDEIILAIPSLPADEMKQLVEICQKTRCRIRILPSVTALTEDRVGLRNVKDIDIEDLLGREPVRIMSDTVSNMVHGKVVMVTGGGGSIGSEICRQVLKYNPERLIIVDIYENNVYDLQQELFSKYGKDLALTVLIASVRDKKRIEDIFEEYKPQIVYHAAAHKHVPLMEDSPEEAIKNNVIGTSNVAKAAAIFGAERFVLISTDKAVNPTSVMGASKRLAEMTVLAIAKRYPELKCGMVRFGNVLGSNGSVVPLFKKQIERERRVTVTDPEMRRYFMTIPEAVSLVLQASVYAEHGEIFVLDMGEPVKIVDLATAMIKLSGYEPNVDVPIEFIGLRPGEKMFEELYFDMETLDITPHEKIMKLRQIEDPELIASEIEKLFLIFGHDYPELKDKILKRLQSN